MIIIIGAIDCYFHFFGEFCKLRIQNKFKWALLPQKDHSHTLNSIESNQNNILVLGSSAQINFVTDWVMVVMWAVSVRIFVYSFSLKLNRKSLFISL
jgi:hypothetical protein